MALRSVRNNNPCNIERGQPWAGQLSVKDMTPVQRAESRFCVFRSPEWGFRAAYKLLQTYRKSYGLDTPYGIVSRFAPANENNTDAYARAVSKALGTGIHDAFPPTRANYFSLIKAMATHETGAWSPYWADRQLHDGMNLL